MTEVLLFTPDVRALETIGPETYMTLFLRVVHVPLVTGDGT